MMAEDMVDRLHVKGKIVAGRIDNRVHIGNHVIVLASRDEADSLMDALDELISDLTDNGVDDDC